MVNGRPAGFWIRALALVVDFALFFVVETSLSGLGRVIASQDSDESLTLGPVVALFTLIFAGLYTSALHTMCGQTIGKMVLRIRVVGQDGDLPTFGTALLRYFGYFASLVTFTMGYVMAALRRDKRALHDLIAGTRVERLERLAPPAAPVETPAEPLTVADDTPSSGYL